MNETPEEREARLRREAELSKQRRFNADIEMELQKAHLRISMKESDIRHGRKR